MDILNSDWLIRMLEKSSTQAEARMLNLFDILDDWLNAPKISAEIVNTTATSSSTQHALAHYLTVQAAKAGAAMPEMLANQLYFMAIAAIHEQRQSQHSSSLHHAKQAAQALITAQTTISTPSKKESFHFAKKTVYASAASLVAVAIMVGGLYTTNRNQVDLATQHEPAPMTHAVFRQPLAMQASNTASPEQTAALFARVEQMRKGNCQLIEALQLPDSYRKVYFENVVLGQISTNADEQRLANALLDKVRCNYSPMLMANSKN